MNKPLYTPNTIQIEFTQGCDRRCEFCGSMGVEHKIHKMSFNTLERIISEIKRSGWNCKILLAGHGEPTINENYLDYILHIRKELPKAPIHIMTNGYSIKKNPEAIEWMFYAGATNLILDEYLDNPLQAVKEHLTNIGIPYFTHGEKGVPLFDKTQRVVFNPPIETSKPVAQRTLTNHCGAGMPPLSEPKKARCTKPFREMYFRWDGNVAICCDDFRGEYGIGNIHEMSIEELWMHPRFESARKFLYQGNRCFHPCSICATSPIRPGLLPDRMGKESMPEPTEYDWEVVSYRSEPYAKIQKREWES